MEQINVVKLFNAWAKDAREGDIMECTNTAVIEAESGDKFVYIDSKGVAHHVVAYEWNNKHHGEDAKGRKYDGTYENSAQCIITLEGGSVVDQIFAPNAKYFEAKAEAAEAAE